MATKKVDDAKSQQAKADRVAQTVGIAVGASLVFVVLIALVFAVRYFRAAKRTPPPQDAKKQSPVTAIGAKARAPDAEDNPNCEHNDVPVPPAAPASGSGRPRKSCPGCSPGAAYEHAAFCPHCGRRASADQKC